MATITSAIMPPSLITLVAFVVYGQRIDLAGVLGMGLIIAGVVVLNVFSKSSAH